MGRRIMWGLPGNGAKFCLTWATRPSPKEHTYGFNEKALLSPRLAPLTWWLALRNQHLPLPIEEEGRFALALLEARGHEVLRTDDYGNPFWNTTGLFKTSSGHSSRISVFWCVAAGETERGLFYGDRMSYIMARPEDSPSTVVQIEKDGKTVTDSNGYPEGKVRMEVYKQPTHWEMLPALMRVNSGHGGSHTFLANEFINAIVEDRLPAVNVWEAVAYTPPGIIAH